jgi:hypothetical protein
MIYHSTVQRVFPKSDNLSVLDGLWLNTANQNDSINVWVGRAHHHAVIIMLSSSCELDRHIGMLSSILHHLVSSACYFHHVSYTYTSTCGRSSCCHHLVTRVSSSDKSTPPKRRFWKAEQKMKSGFSKHFSRSWVLNLGHEPLKSASLIRISSLFLLPKSSFGEHKIAL